MPGETRRNSPEDDTDAGSEPPDGSEIQGPRLRDLAQANLLTLASHSPKSNDLNDHCED
jgi:hypothetical protein